MYLAISITAYEEGRLILFPGFLTYDSAKLTNLNFTQFCRKGEAFSILTKKHSELFYEDLITDLSKGKLLFAKHIFARANFHFISSFEAFNLRSSLSPYFLPVNIEEGWKEQLGGYSLLLSDSTLLIISMPKNLVLDLTFDIEK